MHNGWQQLTANGIEYQRVVQLMTTSDDERQHITTNDSKWQLQVAQRVTKRENKWDQVMEMSFRFKNEKKATLVPEVFYSVFYAMHNCYIFQ